MKAILFTFLVSITLFAEGFFDFKSPLARPFGAPIQQAKSADHKVISSYSKEFIELAREYANKSVEYEELKAVTLAMMILESGRGNSNLATKHYNFGGLKYRKELSNHASSVRYNASDGIDKYCKFESPAKFLDGFWAFIDRSPYVGWRSKARSQKEFIEFIAPIYCPFNKEYASHVLSLVPEANALLDQFRDDGFKVAMKN